MKSKASGRFWKCYNNLPEHIQRLADKNYRLWVANPHHPSLDFKRLKGGGRRFSVRVGDHYRALGEKTDDGVVWVWVGTHEEYNRLTGH